MRVLLATAAFLAAAAVPAAPAEARDGPRATFVAPHGGQTLHGSLPPSFRGDFDRRRDGRRHRRSDEAIFLGNWGYNDIDGGSVWRRDSFNDWWHESPNRAYPKWVTSGTCDRVYWAGGGWRC